MWILNVTTTKRPLTIRLLAAVVTLVTYIYILIKHRDYRVYNPYNPYKRYIFRVYRNDATITTPYKRIKINMEVWAMLEKEIEKKLVEGVKKLGGRAYKIVSPGNVGVPDRLVLLPGGRIVFVELKTPVGRLSKMQKFRIAEMQRLGAEVLVYRGDCSTADLLGVLHEGL